MRQNDSRYIQIRRGPVIGKLTPFLSRGLAEYVFVDKQVFIIEFAGDRGAKWDVEGDPQASHETRWVVRYFTDKYADLVGNRQRSGSNH